MPPYEKAYCGRDDIENRIKELPDGLQELRLRAARTALRPLPACAPVI